jgi:4a-hydroxytetrahydrobiopterin dehydratase
MESCSLADRECVPCKGGTPPLKGVQLIEFSKQVQGWNVIEEHHLSKTYKFPDFVKALAFVNRVGDLAEKIGHHPDLHLSWGKVGIEIWTHKINGLSESDFILAAKVDKLYS